MPRLSKIGAACLAAFGFTTGASAVTASYLAVGGGAGGGGGGNGGGGGAGGYLTGTVSLNITLSYAVTVGAGGIGGIPTVDGSNGANSSIGSLVTAYGGGGGGYNGNNGKAGASGGGSGGSGGGIILAGGAATPAGQGNAGGNNGNGNSPYPTGGGGGAGAVGGNGSGSTSGSGGNGLSSSISGTSVTYAGGGGGGAIGTFGGAAGAGGTGGGGAGVSSGTYSNNGTANLGGGGGGAAGGGSYYGGNGGSGIVIISYAGAQQFGGGVVTSVGGNTIHTFTTSGTLSPLSSLTASYLIVGGGGGGGAICGGGGGGGGLYSGSSLTLDTSSTYLVTVGAGGAAGPTAASSYGVAGGSSSFSMVTSTATGGGYGGGGFYSVAAYNGGNGASGGGGGGYWSMGQTSGGTGTAGQGFNGGNALNGTGYPGGGGGGFLSAGANGTASQGGNGGNGTSSSISGTSTYYCGGGGGGVASGTAGAGGNGGAAGSVTGAGNAATAGSGGGGGGGNSTSAGGNGGSGSVTISYPGSTQQMAGGTVTIVGGNVIHTFTSSGYLTPLTFVNNSLRFRASNSAYLSRTPTVAGSRTTWTWSGWVKRGDMSRPSGSYGMFGCAPSGEDTIRFNNGTDNALNFYVYTGGYVGQLNTTQVFRDPAAWYHIVCVWDTTNATSTERMRMYVNGTRVTAFATATYPSQNAVSNINNNVATQIGWYSPSAGNGYFDGYMTEVRFIDGQALAPTAFGTFNSYGVWQPINYGGSYGTNGFYLPFNQGSSSYYGTFNGSTQYLTVADNAALQPGSGAWTVEFWAYVTGSVGTGDYEYYTKGAGIQVYINSGTHNWKVALSSNNTTTYFLATDIGTPVANTWQHIAVTYDGTTYRGFLNGVQGFATASATLANTGSSNVGIGAYSTSPSGYGNISNVRFVKGTAVYTGNFIPPTSPLTNISGTGLLTLQSATIIDNSSNAFTITNNGSVTTTASSTIFANTVTLTADQSPSQNNWTANNISTTSGSTYDSMTDVPTLTSATTANYCTLNPVANGDYFASGQSLLTLTNGNLNYGTAGRNAFGTIAVSSGKWYWEISNTANTSSAVTLLGLVTVAPRASVYGVYYNSSNGYKGLGTLNTGATETAYGATWTDNDIIGVALDMDAATPTVTFYKNNSSQGAISVSSFVGQTVFAWISNGANSGNMSGWANFGQRGFNYTPPTGYVALNTYNM